MQKLYKGLYKHIQVQKQINIHKNMQSETIRARGKITTM